MTEQSNNNKACSLWIIIIFYLKKINPLIISRISLPNNHICMTCKTKSPSMHRYLENTKKKIKLFFSFLSCFFFFKKQQQQIDRHHSDLLWSGEGIFFYDKNYKRRIIKSCLFCRVSVNGRICVTCCKVGTWKMATAVQQSSLQNWVLVGGGFNSFCCWMCTDK